MSKGLKIQELTWMAVLIAMNVVLSKLVIGVSNIMQIGFGFVALALIGYYFGPFKAAIANVLADIIANTVFPSVGGFFWGFTLSALVAGVIYGLMLHNRKVTLLNSFLTTLLVVVIINLGMNTLWIHMMYQTPVTALLASRLPKEALSLIYQTAFIYIILRWVQNSRFNKIGR
ncbi:MULTISPECIES: folate family ECF transporter S component [Lactobacillaceae]|uniref:folate family ECF transporter S component n=1 Tax=Lactobacillaceae TaxID=33958 RepID=UPI000C1B6A55|nr:MULTISPECIES: folate family ECF transporter S component [Lactobacillaceae]